jgi:hypothetical protein
VAVMKAFGAALGVLLTAVPVYAGPVDASTFFGAPALGEAGLLALAVATGLVGIRMIGKQRRK